MRINRFARLGIEEQEEWYFSIVDVIDVLTGSENPRRYWSDLKRKLKAEGATQLYENNVANVARQQLEAETGLPVITSRNAAQLNAVVTEMIEASAQVLERHDAAKAKKNFLDIREMLFQCRHIYKKKPSIRWTFSLD